MGDASKGRMLGAYRWYPPQLAIIDDRDLSYFEGIECYWEHVSQVQLQEERLVLWSFCCGVCGRDVEDGASKLVSTGSEHAPSKLLKIA